MNVLMILPSQFLSFASICHSECNRSETTQNIEVPLIEFKGELAEIEPEYRILKAGITDAIVHLNWESLYSIYCFSGYFHCLRD
jgi:hypothetical protein